MAGIESDRAGGQRQRVELTAVLDPGRRLAEVRSGQRQLRVGEGSLGAVTLAPSVNAVRIAPGPRRSRNQLTSASTHLELRARVEHKTTSSFDRSRYSSSVCPVRVPPTA